MSGVASGQPVELFLKIVVATISANTSVTALVLLGVAATFQGVFDQRGISDLGKLVYRISLPSLLLHNIVDEVTVERLRTLWLLPAFCTIHIGLAYVVAKCSSTLLRLNDVEERATVATIMFGNVGTLAIAVCHGLCQEEPFKSNFGGNEHCHSKSVSFIAFYLITQNIWMFSWGERILFSKPQEVLPQQAPAAEGAAAADSEPLGAGGGAGAPLLAARSRGRKVSQPASSPLLIQVPSLTAMSTADKDGEQVPYMPYGASFEGGSRPQTPHRSRYASDPPSPQGQHVQVRLTMAALQEVSSRLALEVKPWAAAHHGGEDAIRAALEDEEEETVDAVQRRFSQPTASLHDAGAVARLRTALRRARRRVWETVQRWSVRRTYRGTRRRCINAWRATRSMLQNPPLQAACVALVVGLSPLKAVFVGDDAPLRSVLDAVKTLGASQVPVSMLMLSGSGTLRYLDKQRELLALRATSKEGADDAAEALATAPVSFTFSHRAVALMVLGRLIAVPCGGYVCWWVFRHYGWLPAADPLLGFVLLIESAVPSAQNVVMLLLVHGELAQGAAMAEVILWQYAAAIPVFTVVASFFAYAILGS